MVRAAGVLAGATLAVQAVVLGASLFQRRRRPEPAGGARGGARAELAPGDAGGDPPAANGSGWGRPGPALTGAPASSVVPYRAAPAAGRRLPGPSTLPPASSAEAGRASFSASAGAAGQGPRGSAGPAAGPGRDSDRLAQPQAAASSSRSASLPSPVGAQAANSVGSGLRGSGSGSGSSSGSGSGSPGGAAAPPARGSSPRGQGARRVCVRFWDMCLPGRFVRAHEQRSMQLHSTAQPVPAGLLNAGLASARAGAGRFLLGSPCPTALPFTPRCT